MALVAHNPEPSLELGIVASDVQQSDGEDATGPVEGKTAPSELNRDIQAPTSSSGLFLRRGDVVVLSEGNFPDGLEEFEKQSLVEQRREMGEALAKVY